MALTKTQIKFLKKEAHDLKTIYQIGKLGLNENFIEQIYLAIERQELVKFKVLQNSMEDIKEAAQKVAEEIDAEVIQTVGHTATLYRESGTEKYRNLSLAVSEI